MEHSQRTNPDLEKHRRYLRFVARQLLDGRLRSKLDESDIVQETMISAVAKYSQFRGETEPELLGWLRTILRNKVAAAARRFARACRDPHLEVALQNDLNQSSVRLESILVGDITSPSQKVGRKEEIARFIQVMCSLPDEQRTALELHHLDGLSLAEVAAEMNRTKPSIAGLLFRGTKELRKLLAQGEDDDA